MEKKPFLTKEKAQDIVKKYLFIFTMKRESEKMPKILKKHFHGTRVIKSILPLRQRPIPSL